MESETLTIDKKAFAELIDEFEELQLKLESLELMNDKEVMESHKRAKEQIKNRDFANWDEL